jgi:hypothetical protein
MRAREAAGVESLHTVDVLGTLVTEKECGTHKIAGTM